MGEIALRFAVEFERYDCAKHGCGASILIPTGEVARLRLSHQLFHCLYGHPQSFPGQSELELAKAGLEAVKQRLEWAERDAKAANARLTLEQRKTAAAKGQMTKLRNRVSNGVCPCCNRTFQNLMRHMHTKHPEFKREEQS